MPEKKKIRFNIIDCIVLLVILAVVGFTGYKLFGQKTLSQSNTATYIVSYFCEEVPDFAADVILPGDPVSDETKNVSLGTITDVQTAPSASYATDAEGNVHKSSKEGYKSVTLTTEVEGGAYEHGVSIGASKYGVGHSITLRAGKAKIFGRVSGIDKK